MTKEEYLQRTAPTRAQRLRWWQEARFGMFIHWGLYSQLGRAEWALTGRVAPDAAAADHAARRPEAAKRHSPAIEEDVLGPKVEVQQAAAVERRHRLGEGGCEAAKVLQR